MSTKKVSGNRLRILFMTALSFIALAVTGVSTAAWFAVNLSGAQPTHNITAGSSDITIDSVTGFKYAYSDRDVDVVDYTKGTVTSHTVKGTRVAPEQTLEEIEAQLDIPEGGVGYYLIGDRTWAGKHGSKDANDEWTYRASEKLIEKSTNQYYKKSLSVAANEVVQLKHHYFAANGVTTNSVIIPTITGSAQIDDTNKIKFTTAGTYTFFFEVGSNSTYKVHVEASSFSVSGINVASRVTKRGENNDVRESKSAIDRSGPTPKKAADTAHLVTKLHIYLSSNKNNGNGYANDNAQVRIHLWGGKANTTYPGIDINNGDRGKTKTYIIDISAYVGFTGFQITRWASDRTSDWSDGNRYNSYQSTVEANTKNKITDNQWGSPNFTTTLDTNLSGYDNNSANGFYLMGTGLNYSGTSYSTAWSTSQWIACDSTPVTGNVASWTNVTFGISDNYGTSSNGFKIVKFTQSTTGGTIEYYNLSLAGRCATNQWFSGGGTGQGAANVKCLVANTYNVYYQTDGATTFYISRNYSVDIYKVVDGTATKVTTETQSSDDAYSPTVPVVDDYSPDNVWHLSSATGTVWNSGGYLNQSGTTVSLYMNYTHNNTTMTLVPSYFLSDGTTRLSVAPQNQITEDLTWGSNVSALTKTFAACQYRDNDNGIWYVFERADSTWYNSAQCTAAYTKNSGVPTSNETLYAKMVAKPMRTIYIDAKTPNWGSGVCYLHLWGTLSGLSSAADNSASHTSDHTGSYSLKAKEIFSNSLYRATIPYTNITGFVVHNGDSQVSGADGTKDVLSFSDGDYFTIGAPDTGASSKRYISTSDITPPSGMFFIFRASSSEFEKIDLVDAHNTEPVTSPNQLAYEHGVILHTGDYFVLYYNSNFYNTMDRAASSDNPYRFIASANSAYTTTSKSITYDETSYGSANMLQITKQGKYTIYFTNSNTISLAPVPVEGNGYYVMKTTSASLYSGFEDGIRLAEIENSTNVAVYKNLEITAADVTNGNNFLFFRSYNDNVDVHYQARLSTSSSPSYANVVGKDNGTGLDAGLYNVYLFHDGNNIRGSVAATTVSDFWTMNTISRHGANVKDQNTSMVIEIAFRTSALFSCSLWLDVVNSASNLKFAFYADDEILPTNNNTNPYVFMRESARYNTLTTNTSIDSGFDTTADTPTQEYYAYILIDYASVTNNNKATGNFSFRIRTVQNV